ncbi:hypothetical protein, partial [Paenibacillus terrigena]|uniref:hypothetical protein n=1 Tax=Paenibacillus terrigena TaxID=369333 RepID=UPI001B7FDBCE
MLKAIRHLPWNNPACRGHQYRCTHFRNRCSSEGVLSQANSAGKHAEGFNTRPNGIGSHTGGNYTNTNVAFSHDLPLYRD